MQKVMIVLGLILASAQSVFAFSQVNCFDHEYTTQVRIQLAQDQRSLKLDFVNKGVRIVDRYGFQLIQVKAGQSLTLNQDSVNSDFYSIPGNKISKGYVQILHNAFSLTGFQEMDQTVTDSKSRYFACDGKIK
jgi:hypothetical protein